MKTAVIYNHSLEKMFGGYAEDICAELKAKGADAFTLTNYEAHKLPADKIDFGSCVFLDKDILCGLHLEKAGVRLFNNIGAIETCDDKRRTYEALEGIVPMPETIFMPLTFNCSDEFVKEFSAHVVSQLGLPLVAKNPFSSLGWDVFLLKTENEVNDFISENRKSPLLFSKYIEESKGRDVRVYVVGKKAVAAMLRENKNDFRSNIALGGTGTPFDLDADTEKLCIETAEALALDFCGIDLLFSNGKPALICEVNSNAMFKEINKACGVNVAAEIAKHVITELQTPKKFDPFKFI